MILLTNLVDAKQYDTKSHQNIKHTFIEKWKESVALGEPVESSKLPDGRDVLSERCVFN